MIQEDRSREEFEEGYSKQNESFNANLDFTVLNKMGESVCSKKNISNKSSKVSIKNEGARAISNFSTFSNTGR